jgi:hypothetical protein
MSVSASKVRQALGLAAIAGWAMAAPLAHAQGQAQPPAQAKAPASPPDYGAFRGDLTVGADGLSGPGAAIVRNAVAKADFVLLGEDHGMREIPAFITALCRSELAPRGFRTYALELGPVAARKTEEALRAKDPVAAMARFETAHPDGLAFFNIREELDWLSACQAASRTPLDLIGVDQEFLGAGGMLLEEARAAAPGKSGAAIVALQALEAQDLRAATSEGNAMDYFLPKRGEAELARARASAPAKARPYLDAIADSHRIYSLNQTDGPLSNRERALLMKQQFTAAFEAAGAPRTFVRLGAYHLYKGVNPLANLDLGNTITEYADSHGRTSAHLMIVALDGDQLAFKRPGVMAPVKFDFVADNATFADLKPLFDLARAHPDTWSAFDLSSLRGKRRLWKGEGSEFKRLVYGMDVLIVIPHATASRPIVERNAP